MNENFKKLKKKYTIRALVIAFICGVACGLLVAGAVLLALKLTAVNLHMGWYALIGAGVAVLAGVIAYICLMPTEVRLAKKLDQEYSLEERTQTAIAFSGKKGAVIELQRKDAEERLGDLPIPAKGIAVRNALVRGWQYILLTILAFAVLVSAIMVPAKTVAEPDKPENKPFAVSQYQLAAVRELVENVKSSDLDMGLKDNTMASLKTLLDKLPSVENVGEMQSAVYGAIDEVAAVLVPVNSYRKLSVALGEAQVPYLVRATRRGAEVYKNTEFLYYSQVEDFAYERFDLSSWRVTTAINQLLASLKVTIADGLSAKLGELSSNIDYALLSSGVSTSDALFACIKEFALSIDEICAAINEEEPNDEEIQNSLASLMTYTSEKMASILSVQAYNLAMNRHINDRLRNIFELPARDEDLETDFNDGYENVNGDPGQEEPDPGDPDDPNKGGFGDGGNKFGSDDLIFDPDSGFYVEYGDLFARYNAIMQEYLHNGKLTPEQEARVRAYIDILFKGFQN